MDVVFLDANVLFSAAYRPGAGLRRLWTLNSVRLITSAYAAEEARRNLDTPQQCADLATLLRGVEIVAERLSPEHALFATIHVPDKDRPILLAAINAGATHLLTGDVRHFGAYYEREIAGVRIVPPAAYLRAVAERTPDTH